MRADRKVARGPRRDNGAMAFHFTPTARSEPGDERAGATGIQPGGGGGGSSCSFSPSLFIGERRGSEEGGATRRPPPHASIGLGNCAVIIPTKSTQTWQEKARKSLDQDLAKKVRKLTEIDIDKVS